MRTDALDRFRNKIRKALPKQAIEIMLEAAGLEDIQFSDSNPYWFARQPSRFDQYTHNRAKSPTATVHSTRSLRRLEARRAVQGS